MVGRKKKVSLVAVVCAVALAGAQMALAQEAQKSLYERLGGLAPISVVVSDFIDAMVPDAELNKNPDIDAARKRVPAAYLKYHVTAMVCQATGGPCTYQGRGMAESHVHMKITEREWDRMVTIFKGVLAKHNVPEKETGELLEILGSTKADIVVSGTKG
ncbi:MAG TPA: group 1 truncated hemoglobin [Candidatus Krumholzibacteria bacterium]|nr:group 1 truncated hemoglobin [Candidatus Krumholzibacteria bacterium]